MRTLALPEAVAPVVATLREKLIKIGAKVVRHARYAVFCRWPDCDQDRPQRRAGTVGRVNTTGGPDDGEKGEVGGSNAILGVGCAETPEARLSPPAAWEHAACYSQSRFGGHLGNVG